MKRSEMIIEDKANWLTYKVELVNECVMNFEVFEISQISSEDEVYYPIKDQFSGDQVTDKLEEAGSLFSGNLKWDGCINVVFTEQDNCMPHFCDNPGDKFKLIFDQLYKLAAEQMPDGKEYLL